MTFPSTGPAPLSVARSKFTILLIGVFLVHVLLYDYFSDDGFIVLRYANNFALGHGLVYNLGERVEAFTSPLWMAVVTALAWTDLPLLTSTRVMGVTFGILCVLGTGRLAHSVLGDLAPEWRLLPPVLVVLSGSLAGWAGAGLETSLFTFLIIATLLCVSDQNLQGTILASNLLALTRPESVLVLAPMALWFLVAGKFNRRLNVLVAILPFLTLSALTFARHAYYGQFFPNTYFAKTGGGLAQLMRGLGYPSDYALDHDFLFPVSIVTALIVWRGSGRLVAFIAVFLLAGVGCVGGDGLPLYRFIVPVVPPLAILNTRLLASIIEHVRRTRPEYAHVFASLLLVFFLILTALPPRVGARFGDYYKQRTEEVPNWSLVGTWLKENAQPGESLATAPIGAVGYYSGLRVHDLLGLTDPYIAKLQPEGLGRGVAGHEKFDGAYTLSKRPTYLLLGNIFVTSQPRDPSSPSFIPSSDPVIFGRERDILENPVLKDEYIGRSIAISPGRYLNFYQLKKTVAN